MSRILLSLLTITAAAGGSFYVFERSSGSSPDLPSPVILGETTPPLPVTVDGRETPSDARPSVLASSPGFVSLSLPEPWSLVQWLRLEDKIVKFKNGDFVIKDNGTLQLGSGAVTASVLDQKIIASNHLETGAVNSRTIEDGTIIGRDISEDASLTISSLTVIGSTNISGGIATGGDLDMGDNLITNIGATGTDFTTEGGLNLASTLAVNTDDLYVDTSTGEVGIGTSAPAAALDVRGGGIIGETVSSDEWELILPTPDSMKGPHTSRDNEVYAFEEFNGELFVGYFGHSVTPATSRSEIWKWDGKEYSLVQVMGTGNSARAVGSMEVYDGKLYAGMEGISNGDGDVYVYDPETETFSISYQSSGTGYNGVFSLKEYKGKLYAGFGWSNGDADIRVFDGTSWSVFYDAPSTYSIVQWMEVYKGKLYVAIGGGSAGSGDILVCDEESGCSVAYDEPTHRFMASLAVYRGKLYAGIQADVADGGDLLVTEDGENWTTAIDFSDGYSRIHSLSVYNDKLFIGQGNSVGLNDIWIYDGVSHWLSFDGQTEREVFRFYPYNGSLYAGMGFKNGHANIYRLTESLGNQFAKKERLLTNFYAGAFNEDQATLSLASHFTVDGRLGVGDASPDYHLEISDASATPEFALSDDDVAHGLTALVQSDVFSHLTSLSTTAGGVEWTALSDTDAQALSIRGVVGSTDPTDTIPAIKILGAKSDGTTGLADLGDLETLFQVANNDEPALLTVLGGGNVGIGTLSPTSLLDVNGTVAATYFASPNLPPGADAAVEFNKANREAIVVPPREGFDVYDPDTPNAPFSFGAWIYARSNGRSGLGTIVQKGHNTPEAVGYQLHLYAGSGGTAKIGANVRHGDGSMAQQSTAADGVSNGSVPLNSWVRVWFVYNEDGDKLIKTYVNGTEITYGTHQAGTGDVRDDSAKPMYIGNKEDGSVTFDGYIKDVVVTHGKAMSAAEISADYTGTKPSGITAEFDFGEGQGTKVHDKYANNPGVTGSIASSVFTEGPLPWAHDTASYIRTIGIGTSTPQSLLDISSPTAGIMTLSRNDTVIAANDSVGKIQFWNNDTQLTTQNVFASIEAFSAQSVTTDAAAGYLVFRTTGTAAAGSPVERLRIDSSGYVGIGDTSPAALFTVGSGDLFQVNSSGAIAAATGVTTTGDLNINNNSQITFNPSLAAGASDTYLKINPPEAYTGDLAFEIKQLNANNNTGAPSTRNQVVMWGFNIDAAEDSTRAGNWLSLEPDYRPGDGLYKEFHYVVSNPNASNQQTRLFSSTYVEGSTLANSVNTWDFRSSTFNFRNMAGTVYSVMDSSKFAYAGTDGTGFNFSGSGGTAIISKSQSSSGNQTLQIPSSWYLHQIQAKTFIGSGAEFDSDRPSLQVNGDQSTNGNIELFGTGRRITGDFSNATAANRVMFQTSTAHSGTNVGIMPNGNGTAAVLQFFTRSDPTQSERLTISVTSTAHNISSASDGAFSPVPIRFNMAPSVGVAGVTYGSLHSSGRWTFGNTTTDNGVDAVQVTGSLSATTSATIPTLNGGTAANDDITIQGTSNATRTTSYVLLQPTAGFVGINMSDPSVSLDVTGDIEYTGTLNGASDRRLKKNIQSVSGASALAIVSQLEAKTYNKIGSEKTEYGFIAQEVQEFFPEAVSVIDPKNGYLGLNYLAFIPVLAESVKTLDWQFTLARQETQLRLADLDFRTTDTAETLTDFETTLASMVDLMGTDIASLKKKLTALEEEESAHEEITLQNEESFGDLESRILSLEALTLDVVTRNELILLAEQVSALSDFFVTFDLGSVATLTPDGSLDLSGGSLVARAISAELMTITVADPEAATVGRILLPEGETEVIVETEALEENSRILVTPSGSTPVLWIVTKQVSGEGFSILLNEPAQEDLSFDWWIIEEEQSE